jgi:hypothetical protein
MPSSTQIIEMLHQLEIRKAPYRPLNGGNYSNDHAPMPAEDAVKKVELFLSFGGKLSKHTDYLKVHWSSHSEGLLEVFRVGDNEFFVHGEISTG